MMAQKHTKSLTAYLFIFAEVTHLYADCTVYAKTVLERQEKEVK
jgi:hypothetical protein